MNQVIRSRFFTTLQGLPDRVKLNPVFYLDYDRKSHSPLMSLPVRLKKPAA